MNEAYDVIIIGAGPAGLTAGIYAARADLKTLIIERFGAGGQILNTYEVDNYPGMPGITGAELGSAMSDHLDKFEVERVMAEVEQVDFHEGAHTVVTDAGTFVAKTLILATGNSPKKLEIPGEEELTGAGVSYCATCDGAFFKNRTACVVGGGDVAVEDAIFLARFCEKVYLIHRRDELRAVKALQNELFALPNVEVLWDSVVTEIGGEETVSHAMVRNVKTNEETRLSTDAVFVAVGIVPDTALGAKLADTNEGGYLIAGESCETSRPGVYAAGDARKKRLRQIVTAAADGANAITAITDFLTGKS